MKLYLDTSVLGAVFDTKPIGRRETTQLFFETVRRRSDTLYISDLVLDEVDRAPDRVRFSLMTLVRQIRPLVLSESREPLVVGRRVRRGTRDSGKLARRRQACRDRYSCRERRAGLVEF